MGTPPKLKPVFFFTVVVSVFVVSCCANIEMFAKLKMIIRTNIRLIFSILLIYNTIITITDSNTKLLMLCEVFVFNNLEKKICSNNNVKKYCAYKCPCFIGHKISRVNN